jgi:predicted DNA-binding transcriptional regulator AlpA
MVNSIKDKKPPLFCHSILLNYTWYKNIKIKTKVKTMKQYLRVPEVCEYLSIKPSTVWLYCRQKRLHGIKLSPRVTVFSKEDLDNFIANAGGVI